MRQELYTYDASGRRISKKTSYFGSSHVDYTWYVRDAQGNTLHTYTAGRDTSGNPSLSDFDLLMAESYIFGSSRVGELYRNEFAEANYLGGTKYGNRGNKFFELSNHLGNVLTVITDRKFGVADSTDTTKVGYYIADIIKASDYYPFGMLSRSYYAGISNYRYGFNGKENDGEIKGDGNQIDYGMRIYDPRTGRFLSVDPLTINYPWYTPYQFAGNTPIANVDVDGEEPQGFINEWINKSLYDLRSGQKITENNGMSKTIDDPQLGYVDVELVYDTWIKQSFFVHHGEDGQYYYLKNDNGKHDVLTLKAGTIQVKGGHFEPFATQDAIQAKYASELVNGMAVSFAAAVIAPFVAEASVEAAPSAWNSLVIIHNTPELIPYLELFGGMSACGLSTYGLYESLPASNMKPSPEETPMPIEVEPPSRPSWQQSEKDLVTPDYEEQMSFKNGEPVSRNSKGSVRPEGYKLGESIEIKNYDLTTEKGIKSMINNVVKQVRQRSANLPKNTVQNIVLDVRGQKLNAKQMMSIRNRLTTQAGSSKVNVSFKTD